MADEWKCGSCGSMNHGDFECCLTCLYDAEVLAHRNARDEIEQLKAVINAMRELFDESEWDLFYVDKCVAEKMANRERKLALQTKDTTPSDTLTILGIQVTVIPGGRDDEVAFFQNGKLVGRILLENDKPLSCDCTHNDGYDCATARNLQSVACYCYCHALPRSGTEKDS